VDSTASTHRPTSRWVLVFPWDVPAAEDVPRDRDRILESWFAAVLLLACAGSFVHGGFLVLTAAVLVLAQRRFKLLRRQPRAGQL